MYKTETRYKHVSNTGCTNVHYGGIIPTLTQCIIFLVYLYFANTNLIISLRISMQHIGSHGTNMKSKPQMDIDWP
jgi:hypothetical protein